MREYQAQFERLLSRVGKLSTQHQLGCFVSGLKENLRMDVQAARPTTVTDAIGLARLYEAKNWSLKKSPFTESRRPNQGESVPPLPSPNLTKARNPPIRRLNQQEMQERRSRGLCFNCDEKFVPGHRCRKLFLIEGLYAEDDDEEDDSFNQITGAATEDPESRCTPSPVHLHHATCEFPESWAIRGSQH